MNSQFMTEAELAAILKVSKSTLHKLRENGGIPYQRISDCIRYNREDIDAWIKDKGHNQTNERV